MFILHAHLNGFILEIHPEPEKFKCDRFVDGEGVFKKPDTVFAFSVGKSIYVSYSIAVCWGVSKIHAFSGRVPNAHKQIMQIMPIKRFSTHAISDSNKYCNTTIPQCHI